METRQKLTLYRGFPPSNRYSISPFVTKVEFRLRHSKVPYNLQTGSTQEGPSGKIPYIDIAPLSRASQNTKDSRELIGDSSVIISSLIGRHLAKDLNAYLTPEQKATDMGLRALCEEKLYFLNMTERWLDNYYAQRDTVLRSKPWILRVAIGFMIYRKIVDTVHLQGCGRFTKDEQRTMREQIWTTLEDLMVARRKESAARQGSFWMMGGQKPTEADFVLFGFVISCLISKSCPESRKFVKGCKALMDYVDRIHDEFFPDYERWEE